MTTLNSMTDLQNLVAPNRLDDGCINFFAKFLWSIQDGPSVEKHLFVGTSFDLMSFSTTAPGLRTHRICLFPMNIAKEHYWVLIAVLGFSIPVRHVSQTALHSTKLY